MNKEQVREYLMTWNETSAPIKHLRCLHKEKEKEGKGKKKQHRNLESHIQKPLQIGLPNS